MLDFQQKRKIRAVMYHPATLVVLGLLVLIFAHSTWTVWQKKVESDKMKRISMQNVAGLESRDADIQAKIERLGTDPGIEEEIRSKFSVAKANEAMVIVVDDKTATTTTPPPQSVWQKMWRFFIK